MTSQHSCGAVNGSMTSPLSQSDVITADPMWQRDSTNHIKYPPLRFLSRGRDSEAGDLDAPATAGRTAIPDAGSDASGSSADTDIRVLKDERYQNDDQNSHTPNGHKQESGQVRNVTSACKNATQAADNAMGDIGVSLTGGYDTEQTNGYAMEDELSPNSRINPHMTLSDQSYDSYMYTPHSEQHGDIEVSCAIETLGSLSEDHGYQSVLHKDAYTTRQSPGILSGVQTLPQHGDTRVGQTPRAITQYTDHKFHAMNLCDKSLIDTPAATQTSEPWQSSSTPTTNGCGNSHWLESRADIQGDRHETSPAERNIQQECLGSGRPLYLDTSGTQQSWTLADDDFEIGELNDGGVITLGDLTSGNDRNVYCRAVSGMVDGVSREPTDLSGPLNATYDGQESVSYTNVFEGDVDVNRSGVSNKYSFYECQSPYSANKDGTLIHHRLHEPGAGSSPDHAVNSQVNMNGMHSGAKDGGHTGLYGQLSVDAAQESARTAIANTAMTMDNPLSHPVITVIQNENNSDTSSVDSDGVPYRKSALKTRQKKEGSQRTGRKVRFAEPIILNESKTIGLSARERLGLVDKSAGGNRYVYVPSVGLKHMQDNESDKQLDNPKDNAKKSVTFSSDTKLEDAGTNSISSIVTNTDPDEEFSDRQVHDLRQSSRGHMENQNQSNRPGIPHLSNTRHSDIQLNTLQLNDVNNLKSILVSSSSSPIAPQLHQNQSSPTFSGSDEVEINNPGDESRTQRAKIIRRPGIHVSRGKTAIIQSSPNQNSTTGPGTVVTPPNNHRRDSRSRVESQSSLNTIPENSTQMHMIPEERGSPYQLQNSSTSQDQGISIMRHKVIRNPGRPGADSRIGRYFPESRHSSSSSSGEENDRSPGHLQRSPGGDSPTNTHKQGQHLHVAFGQQVLPNGDSAVSRLSASSSQDVLSSQRRNSKSTLDNQNVVPYNGVDSHMNHVRPAVPDNNHGPILPGFSSPSSQELAVLPSQGDTSSVPSPVSGDSGISSSSSLDNLADNYTTLTYIRPNKTKNIIERMDNVRRSKVRISPGAHMHRDTPGDLTTQGGVTRRDSRNSDHRRRIVSDTPSTGGAVDQWTRATEYSPRDDSSVGYDSRSTSMTSTTSEMNRREARTSWSQYPSGDPRSLQVNHQHPNNQHTHPTARHDRQNPDQSQYHDDENPYGTFLNSATNRRPSTSKLVPIPMDILSPRSPGPGGYQTPDRRPPSIARDTVPDSSHQVTGKSYQHDDQSSLSSSGYSSYQGGNPAYGSHQDYSRGQRHPRYLDNQSPQYSSTADIYKMLQLKTRNPFARPNDYR